jgi:hypothetical protein
MREMRSKKRVNERKKRHPRFVSLTLDSLSPASSDNNIRLSLIVLIIILSSLRQRERERERERKRIEFILETCFRFTEKDRNVQVMFERQRRE